MLKVSTRKVGPGSSGGTNASALPGDEPSPSEDARRWLAAGAAEPSLLADEPQASNRTAPTTAPRPALPARTPVFEARNLAIVSSTRPPLGRVFLRR